MGLFSRTRSRVDGGGRVCIIGGIQFHEIWWVGGVSCRAPRCVRYQTGCEKSLRLRERL
jgi:hypothetical protein